jgi:hypothetical protein
MTPLFGSAEIRVHLAPGTLIACEVRRLWLRPLITRKAHFDFDAGERGPAMAALATWIAQGPPGRALTWIIGASEVQYFVLPWSPALIDRGLRDAYARARFEQVFDEDATQAAFYFSRPSDDRGQLVSCVPIELPEELAAFARGTACELAGIKPSVPMVWDQFRDVLETERGTLCIVDGDRQAIVRHDMKRIKDITVRPSSRSVPAASRREGVFRRFSNDPAAVPTQASTSELRLPAQPGFVAAQDAAYAFALCGAL